MPTLSALTRCDFYPRSPCGERLPTRETYLDIVAFLSTLSLRRATGVGLALAYNNCISIHALLAESDLPYGYDYYRIGRFLSTLSLRRATARTTAAPPVHQAFLSTLSLRRATSAHSIASFSLVFLSTLSLRRATGCGRSGHTATQISIHALLAESDNKQVLHIEPPKLFLSTLSLRRATVRGSASFVVLYHFYPRSPCGERLLSGLRFSRLRDFYPRSPCGERPCLCVRA